MPIQIIPAAEPKRTFLQSLGLGIGRGLERGLEQATNLYLQKQKQKRLSDALKGVENIYSYPNMTQEQKFIKAFSALREFPEAAKNFTSGLHQFTETPLQKAQRRKLEQETDQNKGEESFFSKLMGGQAEDQEYEPYERKALPSFMEETTEEITQPKKRQLPGATRGRQAFDEQDPTTWTDDQIRKFRSYKGSLKQGQTLAKMAENEFTRRQELGKTQEKNEKTAKEQKAVKQLLRETGKFNTEEELDEASKTYDLPTAKAFWQESKKPKAKSEAQKLLDKELAKGYIEARNELPKLQFTLENINRLRELGKNLTGIGGYAKAAFKTKSASEYNTLAASLLDPIIKVFNPVGAVPVTKLNWIRETFAPQASDLASTQEGKLSTLERLASQAQQRAQQKIKLYNDYNGEPPESLVLQFDNDSAKLITDFVDNQQYIDQLKKEVPKGKILMLDSQGKPLHVDPNQTMPNGMSAIEYASQFGARVIE